MSGVGIGGMMLEASAKFMGSVEDRSTGLQGVDIMVWSSCGDFSAMGYVVDQLDSLIDEWFPGENVPEKMIIITCNTSIYLSASVKSLILSILAQCAVLTLLTDVTQPTLAIIVDDPLPIDYNIATPYHSDSTIVQNYSLSIIQRDGNYCRI